MDTQLAIHATLFTAATMHIVLPLRPYGLGQRLQRALAGLVDTFKEWRLRARSRRELASLDEYQLRDIGLTVSEASFESGKSFLQY